MAKAENPNLFALMFLNVASGTEWFFSTIACSFVNGVRNVGVVIRGDQP